jgi:hypothetical protein
MALTKGAAMAAIESLLLVTAAGFALMLAAVVLVIIGVRQECKRGTLPRGRPPTVTALLTRRVLGAHFYLLPGEPPERDEPRQRPPRSGTTCPLAGLEEAWITRLTQSLHLADPASTDEPPDP